MVFTTKKLWLIISLLLFSSKLFSQQSNKDYDFMWLKPQKQHIKSVKKYDQKRRLRLLQEYDKNGNCYFIKNDSLNGDVIAIWGREFDEMGRETKTIYAHSNVGFQIFENQYVGNAENQFTYTIDTVSLKIKKETDTAVVVNDYQFNPYSFIESIQNKEELEKRQEVADVYKGKRYREEEVLFNAEGKPIKDFFFNYRGDTIGCSRFHYSNDVVVEDTYYSDSTLSFRCKNYSFFNSRKNKIKSFTVNLLGSQADTADYRLFRYDINNNLIEEAEFQNGKKHYTISYRYKNGRLIQEKYIVEDKKDKPRIVEYSYNKEGELIREKCFDKKKRKNILVYQYDTFYEYW